METDTSPHKKCYENKCHRHDRTAIRTFQQNLTDIMLQITITITIHMYMYHQHVPNLYDTNYDFCLFKETNCKMSNIDVLDIADYYE